jgi:DNA primase
LSVADEIKARLDLVAYVAESVSLKKAGRNYKAPCPFHQERTPSFVVFPETQTWRCFGACGEGGDIFSFAMKQHGLDFKEALEQLAQRAGVDISPRTPEQVQEQAAFERQLGLLAETAAYYNTLLNESPEAQIARDYVSRRNLQPQTIEAFQLGYAPDGWQHTIDHLTQLGYRQDDIIGAGVAVRNERGRVYDRFRHRLVIPIRDGRGRVIGFGARALRDEDNPKYLNSPQSETFDKSQVLYGLDMARREIRETETAIIVEGYMDVMQAHQAGFTNVVAQMGTALTDPQLQVLRKYADRLILALDADQAGVNATMRGLNVARESLKEAHTAIFGRDGSMRRAGRLGIDMRVLVISSGKDPDDLIRENPAEWQRLVREAEPVADYVVRVGTADLDPIRATAFEKEKVARRLLPLLTATESDLQKEANVQKLALRLHLSEKRLMEIAAESRAAVNRSRRTDAHIRQRRPTQAMQQASRQWQRPQPPPPDAAVRHPARETTQPPQEAPRRIDVSPPQDIDDSAGDLYDVMGPAVASVAGWEEGPRTVADTPPTWDDADEAGVEDPIVEPQTAPSPIPIRVQPVRHQRAASQQEGYLLGLLLQKPERIYVANRALREIAERAQERFEDRSRKVKLNQALTALSAADFRDTANKAIFGALLQSLNQDELDPVEYIREAVGPAFEGQIDALWTILNPVDLVLPGNMHRELRSIEKAMRKQGRVPHEPETELLDKVFLLRKEHLRQANEELRFIILEADEESHQSFQDSIDANKAAIAFLDRTLQERAELANH